MPKKTLMILILISVLACPNLTSSAESGTLDTNFSANGKLVTTIGSEFSAAEAVIQQINGKLIAVGHSQNFLANERIAIARYLADGTLDLNFGANGIVTTGVGPGDTMAFAAIPLSTGGFIVAGRSFNVSTDDFTLLRYTGSGALDSNFNGTGVVVTPVNFDDDGAFALIQDSTSTVTAAGYSRDQGNDNFALVRYNLDGTLNTAFGNDGKVTTDFGNNGNDVVTALIQQKNGKLVAAGYSYNGKSDDFAVARYNVDGSPDTTFSNDGRVRISFGSGQDQALSIIQQSDGKLVVAGFSFSNGKNVIAVARLNVDGTLDTTFSSDGKARIAAPSNSLDSRAFKVMQTFDGKILVAGYTQLSQDNFNFLLLRYNINGKLDTTFNDGGKLTTNFGNAQIPGIDQAFAAVMQYDDNIVLAGTSNANGTPSFALARYLFDDEDNDGIKNQNDNCPINANPDQANADKDKDGDACDADDDNDGIPDQKDACPFDANESVDTDGDRVCNHSDNDDDNDGVPDASDPLPLIGMIGTRANDLLGYSVANAGDIDGDGYDDIIVGSPKSNPLPAGGNKVLLDAGSVTVYSGKTATAISGLTFNGEHAGDEFGTAVAGAVDVNNDAVPDIIVGAPKADLIDPVTLKKIKNNVGRVVIYSGSNGSKLFETFGEAGGDGLGISVAGTADTNADGFADFLAGAWKADPLGNNGKKLNNAGAAYLFSGQSHALLHKFTGEAKEDYFGFSLSSADVNGDARADLIVGAYGYDPATTGKKRINAGSVYLFSGADYTLLRRLDGAHTGDRFGFAVAGLADVNGDSRADLVIGAPNEDAQDPVTQKAVKNAGNVHLFSGANGALLDPVDPATPINAVPQINASFGRTVVAAGDFNNDSTPDFAVGAFKYDVKVNDAVQTNVGRISVHSGNTGQTIFSQNGHGVGSQYSFVLGGGGDHNNDGLSDIIVGSPKADPYRPSTTTPVTNAGRVEVITSNQ